MKYGQAERSHLIRIFVDKNIRAHDELLRCQAVETGFHLDDECKEIDMRSARAWEHFHSSEDR